MKTKNFIPALALIISLACSSLTISFDATDVPQQLPDLMVTQIYVSMVDFSGHCIGAYAVNATVENRGPAAANDVTVLEMSTGHMVIVGRLEPGQKMDLQVPAGSASGVYTLNVDPQNIVAESDETNNITSNVLATATPVVNCMLTTSTPWDDSIFTPSPAPSSLTLDMLQNASYHSPDWGDFELTDGVFYRTPPTVQESGESYQTRFLSDWLAFGDVNLDGRADALVFLSTQNGGTGHFVELAVVLDQNGSPDNIATVYLGDRVIVESAVVQDGVISVTLVEQGPNDPLCCPSQHVVMRFLLEGSELVGL